MAMVRRGVLAGLILAVAGCASPRPVAPYVATPPELGPMDPAFEVGDPSLAGFDALEGTGDVGPGDRVVMGLHIYKDGREQIRFVELTASDPLRHVDAVRFTIGTKGKDEAVFLSPVAVVHARLLDEMGRPIRASDGRSATDFLASGLFDMARVMHDYAVAAAAERDPKYWTVHSLPEPERQTLQRGFCTLLSFTAAVNKNGGSVLRGLALDFLGTRGIIQAILGLGSIAIAFKGDATPGMVTLPGAEGLLEAYNLPLSVWIGSGEAMTCVLTVVKPVAPLTLTGGIIAAEAIRTGDPESRIVMRLVSARRGRQEQ